MKNKHEILSSANTLSPAHAYYSRDREENPQELVPPLTSKNKYTDEEIELLENGIKKITLEDALSLMY